MNNFIDSFQSCFYANFDFKSFSSIFFSCIHFIIASFASFYAFRVYIGDEIKTYKDLIEKLEAAKQIEEEYKKSYINFLRAYSIVTGLAASALIAMQTSSSSVPFAIMYGLAGPYMLKDKVIALVKKDSFNNLNTAVSEISNKPKDDYSNALKKIEEQLKQPK